METSHAPQKPIQSQSWKNATVAEKSSSAHPVSNFYSEGKELEGKERVRFHAPKNGFPQRKHSNIFLGKQIWRSWRTKFPRIFTLTVPHAIASVCCPSREDLLARALPNPNLFQLRTRTRVHTRALRIIY